VHGAGRRELRKDLAVAFLNQGITLGQLGRLPAALQNYDTCIAELSHGFLNA
jgi:hypothetical protein